MTKCIFENLTEKQALVLAELFSVGEEPDYKLWFENQGVASFIVDKVKLLDGSVLSNDVNDIVVYCR